MDIAYLFKPDMTGVYLSLRVYFYQELQDNYGKYLPIYIKNKSNHIRQFLKESNKIADDLLIEIDLDNDGNLAKIHSLGTVVAKYYDADNIPSTEDLVSDVNYFLDIYNFILHNYTEKTDISVDEWIEVLSNKNVIDSKMYSILEIMNGFEDKSALSSQIAEKRGQLGFDDEKSYNSTIVSNSRRVKEYLDKKAILDEDGKEIFWMRFFYGKKLKEGFEFTLREELIEALERVNRDIGSEGVDSMSVDESYDSFYDYLIDNGYLFDKETIENYLLSLKVKPFAILTGNSGTGKTKLSQLFAQYLNDSQQTSKNEINSISTKVLVGKSFNSGGWALNKNDLRDLIPIDEFENNYSILVDGVPAEGNLQVNPRLFYKGNELKQHLEKLAEEDEKQKVPLEIILNDEKVIKKEANEEKYLTINLNVNKTAYNLSLWTVDKKNFINIFPFDNIDGQYEVLVDGIKCKGRLSLLTSLSYKSTEFKNYIKKLLDKDTKEIVTIKIKMDDLKRYVSDSYNQASDSINFSINFKSNSWYVQESVCNYIPISYSGIECSIYFEDKEIDAKLKPLLLFTIRDKTDLEEHIKENPNKTANVELFVGDKFNFNDFNPNFSLNDSIEEIIENSINSNYKIIPVGANWTENRHIVGYYNVITNEYQSTPAYDLINSANNSPEPHFLVLDEMNLSHVERYFADFLSAIESGEKIPLYGEEELTLPQNLFIIGTVNVDETTYMFSPKVLDRANVIEFETYSASDYMNDNINLSSPSGNIEYLENPLAGNEIRSYGIDELREIFSDVTVDDEPFWDLLSYEINSFQTILSKSGFDFGFRVINEIVRFMAVAWEYEGKPSEFANWTRYFDACIKQKMLPKLHGSEKIIGETLEELSNLCSDSVIGTEDMVKYPESFKKLEEMKKILRKQRYVSFIN